MPNAKVSEQFLTTTADGTAAGLLTFVSTTSFLYPGMEGYLIKSDGTASQRVRVVDIAGGGSSPVTCHVRFIPEERDGLGQRDPLLQAGTVKEPWYGFSDVSAYHTGAHLCLPSQVVEVNQPIFDPLPSINM